MNVVSVHLFALVAAVRTHLAATDVCVIKGSSYRVASAQVQHRLSELHSEFLYSLALYGSSFVMYSTHFMIFLFGKSFRASTLFTGKFKSFN